jgi:hypothetical protein
MHLCKLSLPAAFLIAIAVLLTASPTMAAEYRASAGGGVLVTGEQSTTNKITITGSSISCTTAKFTGFTPGFTFFELDLHPEYSGCTAFGFLGATINTSGCQMEIDVALGMDFWGCTNGGMVITASSAFGTCVADLENQLGWNGTSVATVGTSPSRSLSFTLAANNLGMRVTKSTGICPLTVGLHSNGTYTGTIAAKASSGEIWRE